MTQSREERIQERAHQIWESEGRPHGEHEAHWHRAAHEIDASEQGDPPTAEMAGKAGLVRDDATLPPEALIEKPVEKPVQQRSQAEARQGQRDSVTKDSPVTRR
jgi:hypothetical protein